MLRKEYPIKYYDDSFLIENGIGLEESVEIEDFLRNLNEYYASLRLNLKMPSSGITSEDRIDLSRFNSIPHFQYKPLAGNRLFQSGPGSSYQSISSNLSEASPNFGNIKFKMKGPKILTAIGSPRTPQTNINNHNILPRRENCFIEEYLDIMLKSKPPLHINGVINK